MSTQNVKNVKKEKYINIFVLLKESERLNDLVRLIDSFCIPELCKYDIKKSFIDNFIYIKIYNGDIPLKDFKQDVEKALERLKDYISWMKVEVIEVR
ncbi:MAG: hypothetical protein QW101_02215 [Ignisphaera sp.]|uniref:Uncharacterized protein n=1 Tax=Ignisphaera aggregans TaxID=334771 RepID=A0A7J3MYF5_9CREN